MSRSIEIGVSIQHQSRIESEERTCLISMCFSCISFFVLVFFIFACINLFPFSLLLVSL